MKIGVLASGRGSNLQAIINAVKEGSLDVEVALVVSDKADAVALDRARNAGIEAVWVNPKEFDGRAPFYEEIVSLLEKAGVQLVVLAGFMRIVTEPLLSTFPNRIINIHPALLPSFPGLHAQRQALDYGAKISGCTVHFVDEDCDTGPIIAQTAVPVADDDDEDSLAERILAEEHKLFPRVIGWIAEGKVSVEGRKVSVRS